jgi:hypothetical protein
MPTELTDVVIHIPGDLSVVWSSCHPTSLPTLAAMAGVKGQRGWAFV